MAIESLNSVAEFYAHAIAIEQEAVRRYREYEAYFKGRGEEVLTGLCHNLARLEDEHLKAFVDAPAAVDLPRVDPREHGWFAGERDAGEIDAFYRVVTARQLLEIALKSECDAVGFFEWVAHTSPDEAVRELARGMAVEEMQHVAWVRDAMEYHARR